MFRSVIVSLCVFIFCAVGYAQQGNPEQYKKAGQIDIIGLWKMNYQIADPNSLHKSLFFADFQVFEFTKENTLRNISSLNDIPSADIKALLKKTAQTGYNLIEDGKMEIKRNEKITDTVFVSVIIRDMDLSVRLKAPIMKKGDLILSYLDANNQMYMQRFLTRFNPDADKDKAKTGYSGQRLR